LVLKKKKSFDFW